MLHFLKENLMNIHGMDEHGEDKMGLGIRRTIMQQCLSMTLCARVVPSSLIILNA